MARGKSNNTLLILVIIGLILLLLFANGSLSFLFVSPKSSSTTTYWATDTTAAMFGSAGLLGDYDTGGYYSALAQKITFANQTVKVTNILVLFGGTSGNVDALGTFQVGISKTYGGSYIWSTTFDPSGYENRLGNWTLPPLTINGYLYVRIQYAGTFTDNGHADYITIGITWGHQINTNEGEWSFRGNMPSPPNTLGWVEDAFYLCMGIMVEA